MTEKTNRMMIVAGRTIIIKGVPVDATDDEVRAFALIKLHHIFKKTLASKGKAS